MTTSPVASCFAALADPKRLAILARLQMGEASVSTLAKPFRMSVTGMRKHVRVLERAGLAQTRKDGRTRWVRLSALGLRDARDFLDGYASLWQDRFDPRTAFIDLDNIDVT